MEAIICILIGICVLGGISAFAVIANLNSDQKDDLQEGGK